MGLRLGIVKALHAVLSARGRGGSFPGYVGLKLDKHFLERFIMPEQVIVVTGTNGKTTTANLIAESLRASGKTVINNHRGDNLNIGIASTLAAGSDLSYRIQADAVVLEVDELTVYRQFRNLQPTVLVVNNFFRDQLDRAGEIETIIRRLIEVTEDFEGDLILNGDDPNVLRIADYAKKARIHIFSVGENSTSNQFDEAKEGTFCPRCGRPLRYLYQQYSHIGRFVCDTDGYGTIEPEVFVDSIDYDKGTFTSDGKEYRSFINAIYAVYNCAAVLTVMKALGIDPECADRVFCTYRLNEGRNEVFRLTAPCTVNLIKNPTGANEVLKEIMAHEEEKNICIILNDNDVDGTDVSWIWDCHFEHLRDSAVHEIICSGTRAYDIALRLKYDGFEDKLVIKENPKDAVDYLNEAGMESWLMSTYSALHSTRAILKKVEKR